ncbi:transposase [Lacticaseibacillus zhaodongensis]|uniref:transposase n=1 Tax=Lacticaseibacillus zhaodongensis TaxID=2668065 RepID=UPI0012D2F7F1
MLDHIHLLLNFKQKYVTVNVVKIPNDASARTWFVAHPETKQLLWGGRLWLPSYYTETLCDVSKKASPITFKIRERKGERRDAQAKRPTKISQ